LCILRPEVKRHGGVGLGSGLAGLMNDGEKTGGPIVSKAARGKNKGGTPTEEEKKVREAEEPLKSKGEGGFRAEPLKN